jgi:hypothetical protein
MLSGNGSADPSADNLIDLPDLAARRSRLRGNGLGLDSGVLTQEALLDTRLEEEMGL